MRAILRLLGVFLVGLALGLTLLPVSAGSFKYTGVEDDNLRTVVNNHEDMLTQVLSDLGTICGRLNTDTGVTYTNFAPTNSGSNTVHDLRRR